MYVDAIRDIVVNTITNGDVNDVALDLLFLSSCISIDMLDLLIMLLCLGSAYCHIYFLSHYIFRHRFIIIFMFFPQSTNNSTTSNSSDELMSINPQQETYSNCIMGLKILSISHVLFYLILSRCDSYGELSILPAVMYQERE